jgi:Anti-sigma factor NepR
MSRQSELLSLERNAWLLEIGRRLRADYDALREPVPERLATLIRALEQRRQTDAVSASKTDDDVD